MFEYQETSRYFAQIFAGAEDLGAEELRELGGTDIETIHRGIHFTAERAALYRINYCTRLIGKITAPLRRFKCGDPDELYRESRKIPWAQLMGLEHTFAVAASVWDSEITHSKYAALRVKDAIADDFRDRTGKRPSVDTADPDLWLSLHLRHNVATLSLETSGGALHKRGYRKATMAAPLKETLAAAIIRLSEWDGERPLVDPMCGSGTLLCEALMHCCRVPAGVFRKRFGFERLPDFDAAVWKAEKDAADAKARPLPEGLIWGGDLSPKAVRIAKENLENLPWGDRVQLTCRDFRSIENLTDTTIVCNPPYGLRTTSVSGMERFTKDLGDFLKQQCTNSAAYIYFGDRQWIKKIHLRTTWKKPLANGPLDGRLVKIDLY